MGDQESTLARLLEAGRLLPAERDLDAVVRRLLAAACAVTGARRARVTFAPARPGERERVFSTGQPAAVEPAARARAAGPATLRLSISLPGAGSGSLELEGKRGAAAFTSADGDAALALVQLAAAATEQQQLREQAQLLGVRAERLLRALEAAQEVAAAIGSASELSDVLDVIAQRGRRLVNAHSLLILLRDGQDLVVGAAAGRGTHPVGRRIPINASSSGQVLRSGQAARIDAAAAELIVPPATLGVPASRSALLVPMPHRDVVIGVLAAFDSGGGSFERGDEQLLRTYGAFAANAVTIRRGVERERLRAALAAAEAERSRFARELHDQTLQTLAALRVALASSLRRGDPAGYEHAIRAAVGDIEAETTNLRAIIADLRPSALDDLGLVPALQSLLRRRREQGLTIAAEISLECDPAGSGQLPATLETAIYRLVQEALTNVVKHAGAERCTVAVRRQGDAVLVTVADDGHGYDPHAASAGFGLPGMRERVELEHGRLRIDSDAGGTTLRAEFPLAGD